MSGRPLATANVGIDYDLMEGYCSYIDITDRSATNRVSARI